MENQPERNNLNNESSQDEKRLEFERKRFLQNLEEQEAALEASHYDPTKSIKTANKKLKNKIIRTTIMTMALIVFCVFLSKAFYNIASNVSVNNSVSINTSVVEIAVINYNRDKGTFPADQNNKVNVPLLRKLGYLSSDVESNCGCEFYLNRTNGSVTAKEIK